MKLILTIEESDQIHGQTVSARAEIDLLLLRSSKCDLLPILVDGLEASVKREIQTRMDDGPQSGLLEKEQILRKHGKSRETL